MSSDEVSGKQGMSLSLTGEHFGQRRPPLYVTIKAVLERYPDGQIFKVCQNSTFAYYCQRKWKIETGEAWERGYLIPLS